MKTSPLWAVVMALMLGMVAFADKPYAGTTAPSPISKVEPEYTADAKANKIEGTVLLRLAVTEAGLAEDLVVARSLDKGLDAQAILAVKQWRFKPGTQRWRAH